MPNNNPSTSTHPRIEEDWYVRAFAELYSVLYAHRSVEEARAEAEFGAQLTNLTENDRVLDLCCGSGRHAGHLMAYAKSVIGLDYSRELLSLAREHLGPAARLVRADMRAIPFVNQLDAVLNFFTSFGYFKDDEENSQVVRGIAEALRPGGRFFIDYLNRDYAIDNIVPESFRTVDDYEVHEVRWIDAELSRLNKCTSISRNNQRLDTFSESVRLYRPAEFTALLKGGGLDAREVFGSYDGGPLSPDAPRMIVTGIKAP